MLLQCSKNGITRAFFITTGTMKSRVNRARARLTELLQLGDDDVLELTDAATNAVVNSAAMPTRLSA